MLLWQLNLSGPSVSARVSWVQFDVGSNPAHARVSWVQFDTNSAGESTTLLPALFTNDNVFYPHAVTTGSVTLESSLFVNSSSFYSTVVFRVGLPEEYTRTRTVYVSAEQTSTLPQLSQNRTVYVPSEATLQLKQSVATRTVYVPYEAVATV